MSMDSPTAAASPADLASTMPDSIDSDPAPLSASTSNRHSALSRPLSYASKNRLSQYSVTGSLPPPIATSISRVPHVPLESGLHAGARLRISHHASHALRAATRVLGAAVRAYDANE
ncbi:uncharacterized protein TrAtP1_006438 [Trichoderma atroviride]|uniref:uncharacterized protein n=1 Tax=Hypocrea atroviridis TaxID=63577 RepID=UPI0033251853|nr:hypothetical protein TrAtP1_006438 [Trichoderma atroviride]